MKRQLEREQRVKVSEFVWYGGVCKFAGAAGPDGMLDEKDDFRPPRDADVRWRASLYRNFLVPEALLG
jgi:hypothetical protein